VAAWVWVMMSFYYLTQRAWSRNSVESLLFAALITELVVVSVVVCVAVSVVVVVSVLVCVAVSVVVVVSVQRFHLPLCKEVLVYYSFDF
jgi:hypothetical protein